jgi:hypothetical protein
MQRVRAPIGRSPVPSPQQLPHGDQDRDAGRADPLASSRHFVDEVVFAA